MSDLLIHEYICVGSGIYYTIIIISSKWGGETYKFLHKLWLEGGYNVSVVPIYVLWREQPAFTHRPLWADKVFGYNDLGERQLEYLSRLYNNNYVYVFFILVFIVASRKQKHSTDNSLASI